METIIFLSLEILHNGLVLLHFGHHVPLHLGHHIHLHVGHHVGQSNVVLTLCEASETLTEWNSKSVTNYGWTDIPE